MGVVYEIPMPKVGRSGLELQTTVARNGEKHDDRRWCFAWVLVKHCNVDHFPASLLVYLQKAA